MKKKGKHSTSTKEITCKCFSEKAQTTCMARVNTKAKLAHLGVFVTLKKLNVQTETTRLANE